MIIFIYFSFGGDLFLSPPSNTSGSSYSDQDYTKVFIYLSIYLCTQ